MKKSSALTVVPAILTALALASCISPQAAQPSGASAPPLSGKQITVFAGSASKPALDEAAALFEKQTGARVYLTYGGSGTVLSQMRMSKTGDIYIPGSPDYMAKAEEYGVVIKATERPIAYLVPSICVQRGNPRNIQGLADLARPGIRVGIGNPDTVCVGLYAIEILDSNGMLESVFGNIMTQATSCENTAALLSLKSVDAIIGWTVFSHWDAANIEAVYLKPNEVPRLAYIPAAVSSFSQEPAVAAEFINFLISPSGQDIFRKWGYDVTESEARKYAPDALVGGDYALPDSYRRLVK